MMQRLCRRILTTAALVLSIGWNVAVATAFESAPLEYETVRTRGMGGVSVPIADDQQALFTNAAGLFQNKENVFAVANVAGDMNQDFRRVKNRTGGLSDRDTPETRAANNAVLNDIMGQHARLQASNLAYYLGQQGFGAGFLYQSTGEIGVVRPTNPRIQARATVDSVLVGGLSRPIPNLRNLFHDRALGWWGGSVKFLSRRYLNREYDARDFAGLSEGDLRDAQLKGSGGDLDFSTFWMLDNPWQASLGLTVNNILESELDPLVGHLPRQIGFGAAIHPLTGDAARKKKLVLAAEMWDLANGKVWLKQLRMGFEALVRPWLTLRGGLRSGYLTAGATARFRVARLDFATYSDERGPRPGDREDRRYSMELSLDF